MNRHWKTFKALLLTLALIRSPLLAQSNCDQPGNVARIDAQGRRLFAVGVEDQIATPTNARGFLKPLANYVSRCQSGWGKHWNISIFTESDLALYKTELESRSQRDAQRWGRSYIGEYSSGNQKLVLNPLSPKAKKWIRVGTGEE